MAALTRGQEDVQARALAAFQASVRLAALATTLEVFQADERAAAHTGFHEIDHADELTAELATSNDNKWPGGI